MSARPDESDPDIATRPSNLVDVPEHYEDWRTYAFSSAPELTDPDPRSRGGAHPK